MAYNEVRGIVMASNGGAAEDSQSALGGIAKLDGGLRLHGLHGPLVQEVVGFGVLNRNAVDLVLNAAIQGCFLCSLLAGRLHLAEWVTRGDELGIALR